MWTRLFAAAVLAAFVTPAAVRAQTTDSDLMQSVLGALRGTSSLTIFDDVSVAVTNRNVVLTGRVTQPFKRDDVTKQVGRIDGVRSVTNNITTLPASTVDASLRVRIAQAIYGNSMFWQYASMANPPIHIIVEHTRVTLTGCVNSQVERMLAYSLAQVTGVLAVVNQLRVEAR